ncbi:MAG TPA: PAS domain-containing sensor histidine kinase [Gemmatimonas aurantiaca]|uniref:histidine kinase n=2 Tax=Gemmatimonas aurantiaca TaxID=173480 RepID=C1A9H4_GEMAT|nr:PAS domain-containing sensor histidine kinase [Gemmatimonas aurantiaca]BAH39151.1 putative two-component histidine kinase [Gemmatimonas aurantiaca T-27]HCT57449.1 PAS domain-containing sensor histidine kinase [Gemmatimonas aurantiaca]
MTIGSDRNMELEEALEMAARDRPPLQHARDFQSFAVLEQMVRMLPHGILVVSDSHGVEFANQAFCDLYGLMIPPAALLGHSASDILQMIRSRWFDPLYEQQRVRDWQARSRARRSMEVVLTDGRVIAMDWTPLQVDGRINCRVWHNYDVTERKHLESMLREREVDFRVMVEGTPMIVLLSEGEEQTTVTVNSHLTEILGYTAADFSDAASWWPLAYPDPVYRAKVANDWTARVNAAIRTQGRIEPMETRVTCADGSVRDIEWGFLSVGKRNVVYGVDRTPRRDAERERARLETLTHHLERSQSLDRMAGAIAHHFNNQLHVVMLSLHIAADELPRLTEVTRLIDSARQAAANAAEVSTKLLTYLGLSHATMKSLDMADICRRMVPILQASAPAGVRLTTSLPTSVPKVTASEAQLQQALLALLSNAWESARVTPHEIEIAVEMVDGREVPNTHIFPRDFVPQSGRYVCVRVTDRGVGIEAPDIDRIFDPFYTTKFVGRGLGLPMTLGIARTHDAAIHVESVPGQGSVFRMYLPTSG